MANYKNTESEIEKKYLKKDTKRAKQMKVSGKSVFRIKKIISDKGQITKN